MGKLYSKVELKFARRSNMPDIDKLNSSILIYLFGLQFYTFELRMWGEEITEHPVKLTVYRFWLSA